MSVPNKVLNYFNLNATHVTGIPYTERKKYIIPQYLALTLGVVIQPMIENYIKTNSWSFDAGYLLGRVLFGFLIAIAIFPAVYKNSWDNNSPIAVQVCSIFSAGLGWQTLFSTGQHLVN